MNRTLFFPFLLGVSFFPSTGYSFDSSSPPDSLVVNTLGNVGVGTVSPLSSMHIKRNNAALIVEDTNNASASGILVNLKKSGIPAFRLTNVANGSAWDFTQRPNQNFTLSKSGSGGFEVEITPVGNMLVRGSVTANGILLTSSRSAKTDFSSIKTEDVMKKLEKINVEEWRYKNAEKDDRHISPMAEDFYSLFKLGPDNKHINPNDLASVALIAAKELQKKAKKVELENEELKRRLSSLEKLVTNLSSGSKYLSEGGKNVALSK